MVMIMLYIVIGLICALGVVRWTEEKRLSRMAMVVICWPWLAWMILKDILGGEGDND